CVLTSEFTRTSSKKASAPTSRAYLDRHTHPIAFTPRRPHQRRAALLQKVTKGVKTCRVQRWPATCTATTKQAGFAPICSDHRVPRLHAGRITLCSRSEP